VGFFHEEIRNNSRKKQLIQESSSQYNATQQQSNSNQVLTADLMKPQSRSNFPISSEKEPKEVGFDIELLEKKLETVLAKYLTSRDEEEALHCVQQLNMSNNKPHIVNYIITSSLEKKELNRKDLFDLLIYFLSPHGKNPLITSEQLVAGLKIVSENLEDLTLDSPMAPQYVAKFVAQAVAKNILCLKFLEDSPKQIRHHEKFIGEVLYQLLELTNETELSRIYHESGLKLEAFFTKENRLNHDYLIKFSEMKELKL